MGGDNTSPLYLRNEIREMRTNNRLRLKVNNNLYLIANEAFDEMRVPQGSETKFIPNNTVIKVRQVRSSKAKLYEKLIRSGFLYTSSINYQARKPTTSIPTLLQSQQNLSPNHFPFKQTSTSPSNKQVPLILSSRCRFT